MRYVRVYQCIQDELMADRSVTPVVLILLLGMATLMQGGQRHCASGH